MMVQTGAATAKDWLEANKDVTISAYVQSYTPTAAVLELPPFPILDQDILDKLAETSVPLPGVQRPAGECDFALELQAWDSLSDEALVNFERELG